MDLQPLLTEITERGASDLHLVVGKPPVLRKFGRLKELGGDSLDDATIQDAIYSVLNTDQIARFEKDLELDFSLYQEEVGRFRVNVHRQRGCVEAAFRSIPLLIPDMDELGLPSVTRYLCTRPNGLVLITGPTGQGKSTTMAAMVNYINETRSGIIVTIEDPIEFIHPHLQCIVKQREVGSDTHSFAAALKHALRQDPDYIMVGEMRDHETIATALTAAETGHLVLSTLHTPDAIQTIDRMIDVFPPHQQQQVKVQLASVLRGIISQQLLPDRESEGLVLASEVLVANSAIRHLIREHKTSQLHSILQTGGDLGMQTMDQALTQLVDDGRISEESARAFAHDPDRLRLSPPKEDPTIRRMASGVGSED